MFELIWNAFACIGIWFTASLITLSGIAVVGPRLNKRVTPS